MKPGVGLDDPYGSTPTWILSNSMIIILDLKKFSSVGLFDQKSVNL